LIQNAGAMVLTTSLIFHHFLCYPILKIQSSWNLRLSICIYLCGWQRHEEGRERYLIFISSQKGKILTHYSAVIFTLLLQTRGEEPKKIILLYICIFYFLFPRFYRSVRGNLCHSKGRQTLQEPLNIYIFKLHFIVCS
jgi:hypothetical protein